MSEVTAPNAEDLTLTNLDLLSPAQINRSVWTGSRRGVGLPGAEVWRGTATIGPLSTELEERPWRVFLWGLRGPLNWFKWILPCQTHSGNRPTVASGASNGYTLPLTGMTASTIILTAGQFMTVPLPSGRSRAVCLTSDLVSNGSGNATALFLPALTETPTLGATVETKAPFIPMSPTDAKQGFQTQDGVTSASLEVEEAR